MINPEERMDFGMKRSLLFLTILLFILSLIPLGLGEEISFTGVVTGGSLHMRSAPEPSAKIVNTYKSGTEVQILENDGAWCKVQVGSKTGYMMTQYLNIRASYPQLGWGKTENNGMLINIHAQPNNESQIIHKSFGGMAFELVEKNNDWYKIRFGHSFGYIHQSLVTVLSGEYAPGLSDYAAVSPVRTQDLFSALREVGNPRKMERSEGDFTYSITWPDLNLPAADKAMESWIQDTLDQLEADAFDHHQGQNAHCTIEYQALEMDDRYISVVLMAEYKVEALRAEKIYVLNIDGETGSIIPPSALLTQTDAVFFSLESELSSLLNGATDGYNGKADSSYLAYAALTRSGLAFYLPMGVFLPDGLGTQRVLIPYDQIAQTMAISSPLISQYIRTIDPTKPMIALTFDDGPSEQTERILNVLKEYGGKATFCVQGINVEKYADTVRRAVAEGHEIASHTWNHRKLTEISASSIRSQLERTNDIVREVTGGYEIKVLRPPYGSVNKNVRSICAEMDMIIAHWKIDTLDWDTRSTSKTYRAIINNAENGAIVLCHDLYSSTASAIEQAVPELVAKGYQLVTVSELMSFHKEGAQPGTVYAYLDPDNIRVD